MRLPLRLCLRSAAAALGGASTRALADERPPAAREYPFVIVGAGIAGRAALHELLDRRPDARVLVVDADSVCIRDAEAIAALKRNSKPNVDCVVGCASSIDVEQRLVSVDGRDVRFGDKCILATGSPPPHVPDDFVDAAIVDRVATLGRGASHDAKILQDVLRRAAAGEHVLIVGAAWPAVELASLAAQAAPAETRRAAKRRAATGEEPPAVVTLLFPEQAPLQARVPRWLGGLLRKRLERRRIDVRVHSQVRYVGPAEDGTGRLRVYVGRAYDAMQASSVDADFVVIAGGEHHFQHSSDRGGEAAHLGFCATAARTAPRGTAVLPVVGGPVSLVEMASPLCVNGELCASSRVLVAGDAAATPPRQLAATVCAAVPVGEDAEFYASSISAHAGEAHARESGAAAGAHAASGDGSLAAAMFVDHVPRGTAVYACDSARAALGGFGCSLVGRCDSELETHAFSFTGATKNASGVVALYVERPRASGPRVVVGVVLWGAALLDGPETLAAAKRTILDARQAAGGADDDVEAFAALRAVADVIATAAPATLLSTHESCISRAERLGPRYAPGAGAADTALFSRGRNSSGAEKKKQAYSAGIVQSLGVGMAQTDAEALLFHAQRLAAEAETRREKIKRDPWHHPPQNHPPQ
ncbi:hypothetical protein M885DRAFT_567255 [Pelagophyceae sp. CCMP2097]|nr:hypothetical protein M885DRAFT_567255 [Pelagophyceae sp. CCMP2097]